MTAERTSSVSTVAWIAGVCTLLVASIWLLAEPRIKRAETQYFATQIAAVLSDIHFDNRITSDTLELESLHGRVTVYRARENGIPVAAVYDAVTLRGYSGLIRVLVGIDSNGEITGVRVISHRETPGLGDSIEISKSDWITGFDNLSLNSLLPADWQVKKDGGQFDQFTGATITPRAIVNLVHDMLKLHSEKSNLVFNHTANN